jgi:methyltransferase (TIGR00027 family)
VLRVFEVDHPVTQAWKRERLGEAGIPIPGILTFAPVNFENQTIEEGLRLSGFDFQECTFFSWLGVTPYLTRDAIDATLGFIASRPAGSGVVFDYAMSPSLMNAAQRWVFDAMSKRVAAAGEPWQTFFDPSALASDLKAMGFVQAEDLDAKALNERYFRDRVDGLQVGSLAHVMNARI